MDYVRKIFCFCFIIIFISSCANKKFRTGLPLTIYLDEINTAEELKTIFKENITQRSFLFKVEKSIGSQTITEVYSCVFTTYNNSDVWLLKRCPDYAPECHVIACFPESIELDSIIWILTENIINRRRV
jgi:hypothetical protein